MRFPCVHAAATTPVQQMGVVLAQNHPSVSAFPDSTFGSACTSTFSRFAQRLLALRPAHSRSHQSRDRYPGASDISSPPCLPRLLPAGANRRVGLAPTGKRRLVTAHPRTCHSQVPVATGSVGWIRPFPLDAAAAASAPKAVNECLNPPPHDAYLPLVDCRLITQTKTNLLGQRKASPNSTPSSSEARIASGSVGHIGRSAHEHPPGLRFQGGLGDQVTFETQKTVTATINRRGLSVAIAERAGPRGHEDFGL